MLAKEQAEKVSRAKAGFLSHMSRELRTPLNAILGFSQVLEMSQSEEVSEADKTNVREILTAGKHLLHLIVEILDLSKIESGNMTINIESLDFNALVDDCMRLSQANADAGGIEIHFDPMDSGTVRVNADSVRIKQVLINLISNAIKYNRIQGKVTLSCNKLDDGLLRVEVKDTGNGIAQDRISKFFKPFEWLGVERTNISGTGIGLLISKQLIELMQGEIGVDSEEGVGTTVWFTIPVTSAGDTVIEPTELASGENPENLDVGAMDGN